MTAILPPATDHPPPILGIPFPLAGKRYIVPPCSLATLRRHGAAIDKLGVEGASAKLSDGAIDTIVSVAHEALRRNYPAIESDFVAENVGLESVWDLFSAIMDASGLLRKKLLADAATTADAAPGEGSKLGESSGTLSQPTS